MKISNLKLEKTAQCELSCSVHRQTDMTRLTVPFLSFANAAKNVFLTCHCRFVCVCIIFSFTHNAFTETSADTKLL
jgi:hypothetical protein